MITSVDLLEFTDRLAKQFSNLLDTIGLKNTEAPSTVDNICDSLYEMNKDLIWDSQEKDLINAMDSIIQSTESSFDVDTLSKPLYSGIITAMNNHLTTGIRNGFYQFAIDNADVRYPTFFVRLLKSLGINIPYSSFIFYDGIDTLGTFVLSGSTSGAWTESSFDWGDYLNIWGSQPSSQLEIEAKTAINIVSNLVVDIVAIEAISNTVVSLTATLPAGSPIGAKATLTGSNPYQNYIYEIRSITVSNGTASDEFYVNFKPIRVIALD